ncbi:MAG: cobalamin-independent methionine synthase II family protein [Anaerolineae bacterium]|jgi:5-methyltetrahydropteroyltriglutamate--homocysteine methyltransferase|nr:cobalamin-independent methionine synthase II family protein [Anaerolineae bacterium]MBT3714924.1 cobalamin-independent methionine synthase II family protein [Anaerolineae bacterium]MBT4311615.1 cobalamin-independent methionine synthase II family protein [Anaerolineae bacterium]MBT4459288.1 cobalamin-independent methionine synthase II family protein [Anaerolineae bacterium]MBT4842127.1 cobalamin-independent methionine synthase II family protein [Anaerolineae bacterium]
MSLLTTTIGAYPKPDYVPTPDWFREGGAGISNPTTAYQKYLANLPDNIEEILDRGTEEVVNDQVSVGIDIPADGEVRRENYIHYHCRHIKGFDFENLTRKVSRQGAWEADLPTITGPLEARDPFLPRDYRIAQGVTDRPIKITVPGPMTITDSVADAYYNDDKSLGAALATALNAEILALVDAGCTWIQVDEPVFARNPNKALDYGFENLERCFEGVPDHVTRAVHMCCGYPEKLDQENFQKADQMAYFQLADAIEASSIQAISLEDAHRHNDLSLLEKFKTTSVIFGVIAIAQSRIETVDEITKRLNAALEHIDADRLIAAPDCGLGFLNRELVLAKLGNMVAAARGVG